MKPTLVLPAVLALTLFAGCSRHSASRLAVLSAGAPLKAQAVAVRAELLPTLTEIPGAVQSRQRAQLAAKVLGAIEEMPVALGQRVRQGEPLVRISAGDIEARVAEARSQANEARRDLARERELLLVGASTPETVKNLEDRCAGAEAMLREAEAMLGYATIRAPFDGIIARKFAGVGDLATPGLPLLEIEGTSGFDVVTGIPDSLVPGLAIGMPIAVAVPAVGVSFTGNLSELSSASDPNVHAIAVKIAAPRNALLRSGQFARVWIPGAPISMLLAPSDAISAVGQMERAFVAGADNRAALRIVRTGAHRGNSVEILSGLDDGERVLVAPPAGLREGQPLEILP